MKVVNVLIVFEVDLLEEFFNVDLKKCIGLKISLDKLNYIRKEWLKLFGFNDKVIYVNINRIKEELEYFEKIVDWIGCQVVDVLNKVVEEIVNIIYYFKIKNM